MISLVVDFVISDLVNNAGASSRKPYAISPVSLILTFPSNVLESTSVVKDTLYSRFGKYSTTPSDGQVDSIKLESFSFFLYFEPSPRLGPPEIGFIFVISVI